MKIKCLKKFSLITACVCMAVSLNSINIFADSPVFDVNIPSLSSDAPYVVSKGIVYNFIKEPGNVSLGEVSVGNNQNTDISDIVIPNSITVKGKSYAVTKIEDNAFSMNDNIKTVSFGKSVKTVNASAFMDCSSLSEIKADLDSPYFASENGVLYTASFKSLVKYPEANENKTYTLNSAATEIRDYAFYGSKFIEEVIFSPNLFNVGKYAFADCQSLKTVNMGVSAIEIKDYAFYKSSVKDVSFSPTLTSIGKAAFAFSDVTEVTLPAGVAEVSEGTFYGCESLSRVNFGSGIKIIGKYAFANTNMLSVELPSRVTEIKDYAFYNCGNLKNVNMGSSLATLGDKAFYNCSSVETFDLPITLNKLGKDVFTGCGSLKSFTAKMGDPKGCTIESGILYNDNVTTLIHYPAANIASVYVIPSSLSKIEDNALVGCKYINEFSLVSDVNSFRVEDGVLYDYHIESLIRYPLGKGGSNVYIPDSVKRIENNAFKGSDVSGIMNLPPGLESIGEFAFDDCKNIYAFNIDGDYLTSENGVIYNKDKTELIKFPEDASVNDFEVPSSVRVIRSGAFKNSGITSVKLNEGLEEIGDYAFADTGIENIEFPSTLTEIGDYAFTNTKISTVVFPEAMKSIGDCSFKDCESLKSIEFVSEFVTEKVQSNAFLNCHSLSSIVIPSNADFKGYMEMAFALNIDDADRYIVKK